MDTLTIEASIKSDRPLDVHSVSATVTYDNAEATVMALYHIMRALGWTRETILGHMAALVEEMDKDGGGS